MRRYPCIGWMTVHYDLDWIQRTWIGYNKEPIVVIPLYDSE